MSGPEAVAEAARHLVAHLVAARADRRPDDRREAGRRAVCAAASTIPSSRPRQPAWSTASAGASPFVRARAISTQSAPSASIGIPGSSVQRPSPGTPREPASARLTTVECVWKPSVRLLLVRADPAHRRAAVLVDALDLVAGPAAEVERLERAFAHAAVPRREDDLVRAGGAPSGGAGRLMAARSAPARLRARTRVPSSSPFSFRRRSSARISPTRGDSARPSCASRRR